jgi:molybdopterin molybdotransferase
MKEFFNVVNLEQVFDHLEAFQRVDIETVSITASALRIIAQDVLADVDLPGFSRSTMDGFAIRAASSFGASEANPAYLTVVGQIGMGEIPGFDVATGQAARIATGGMLPAGADAVVMVEHTAEIDAKMIEVYRSVAPGQHVIEYDEDFKKGAMVLQAGRRIRPQETGLLAAFGQTQVSVFGRPVVGIISTGDEVVDIEAVPQAGQVRDINSYTLASQVLEAGGQPIQMGLVKDDFEALGTACRKALSTCDMVLISGGSSVGMRDFTIDVLSALPGAQILVHGISISPGKPTILAHVDGKAVWGLPGHVVSAMVVFATVVRPFLDHIGGQAAPRRDYRGITARLTRSLASAQGRVDFVRVQLKEIDGTLWADPVLGKSGLINTMVQADGLIEVGQHTEGLDQGAVVSVKPFF